jgi:hypothetical protein
MGQRGIFRLIAADVEGTLPCTITSKEFVPADARADIVFTRPYGWESYLSLGYDYALQTGCMLQNFSLTVSREPTDQYDEYTPTTNQGKMELQYSMDQDASSYYSIFRMYNERPGYFEDRTQKDLELGVWGGDGTAYNPSNNQYLAYWNAWGDEAPGETQAGPPTPKNKFYVGWYQQNGQYFDQMYYHNKGSKPGIFAIDCKNNYSDVLIKSNLSDGSVYAYYQDSNAPNFGLLGADVVNGGSNGTYSHAESASSSSDDQAGDSTGPNDGIPGFSFDVVKPQDAETQADTAFLIGLHKQVPEMAPYMNADLYTPNNYGHLRLGYSAGDSNFFRMGDNQAQCYFTVEMGGFLQGKQFIWAYDYYYHNMAWNLDNYAKFHMWTQEGNMIWLSVPAITAGVGEAAIWASDTDNLNLLWGSRKDGKLQLYSADGDYIAHYVKDEASFWYAPAGGTGPGAGSANCKFSSKENRFQVWESAQGIYIDLDIEDLSPVAPANAKFRKVCAGGKSAKGVDGKDVYVLATSEFDAGAICAISYGDPFIT